MHKQYRSCGVPPGIICSVLALAGAAADALEPDILRRPRQHGPRRCPRVGGAAKSLEPKWFPEGGRRAGLQW